MQRNGAAVGRGRGRILTLLAGMVLMSALAVAAAQPAYAQEEDDEQGKKDPGLLTKGRIAAEGLWDGLTGPSPEDFADDSGSGEGDDSGGGQDEGEGKGDGSGGQGEGVGSDEPQSTGQGRDDATGEYGAWTKPINIAQGLVFICAGIGLSAGILTVGTAGGSREQHQKGIEIIGNTLAGFILGTLAVQIYNVLGDVVVGF